MNVKITWQMGLESKTVEVASGTTLLDAAIEHDVRLEHACGGCCACTTCQIFVASDSSTLSKIESEEAEMLEHKLGYVNPEAGAQQPRLSCQTKVLGDTIVRIPGIK